ncbi:heat-inducible transcriptional repressor HrcA [Arthrobacter agilis]|uniref:heat-inducible transcriptional repressor HrcA n=1 Tax=Arthrobacter agilis TaxID=37921 RepID=UPI000B357125|nr:heat-inducible transcriptional repressor HrcA [Arthrobacter agilis]OUM45213.1 heat-inducible transcriptional repressor HrcA [Arthrobacter agilis]PPB47524.1 heat-inducible transcriptional repressor HrcA [Arthrobacter agilis]TPV21700.1 heat-inducible transcriptional repressor HrcA [Arthrobacter agilis]VDR32146.1 Heat-inducible transcription repressor HrcA [Arthrobacter agilis]
MSEPRRLEVLRAIVEDYVHSREPVGSKALVDRHRLGVSSATIRNDMAVLEEEGLIAAPHTSSGRIPTDKGYRLFVDRISEVKPLSAAEKKAIQTLLEGAEDVDDVMDRTVRLLAQLTNQVAVVQFPRVGGASVRHIEFVLLAPQQVLVVLIATNGTVQQRIVRLPSDIQEGGLAEIKQRVLSAVSGAKLEALPSDLGSVASQLPPGIRAHGSTIVKALEQLAGLGREDRMLLAGTANLARSTGDFPLSIGPVLEALEEQVVMLRLLSEMEYDARGISVRIGSENPYGGLSGASVVATGYGPDAGAKLGVLGPTRMDYPTTMAAVRAVARYLSRILDE